MSRPVLEATRRPQQAAVARRGGLQAPTFILTMRCEATDGHLRRALARIESFGFQAEVSYGTDCALIGVAACPADFSPEALLALPGVERATRADRPCKLVGLDVQPEGSTVRFGDFEFGTNRIGVIAGPCAVESRDQMLRTAEAVKRAGAIGLRGGAFKPRTSPYAFRGLEEKGLELLVEAREATGLPICTEVMEADDVPLVAQCADMLQIGARNMQNFNLLEAVGRTGKPALLKRGMSATPEELLQAAEYIAKEGNKAILLCERGVRTFESYARNTLSLAVVPHLQGLTHLPVLVDPSHGTGRSDLVEPAMLGAVAVGADGLLVEVHPDPAHALCDGEQSLNCDQFREAMAKAARVAEALGREA